MGVFKVYSRYISTLWFSFLALHLQTASCISCLFGETIAETLVPLHCLQSFGNK